MGYISAIADVVNFDHLTRMMSARFLYYKVIFYFAINECPVGSYFVTILI